MNVALVLSGGKGARLGEKIPKQYIEINEKPIISYCLEVLNSHPDIHRIQVAADEPWRELIRKHCSEKLAGFSEAGLTRQLSVLNGLKDIRQYADERDHVLICDAARPMISAEIISQCLIAAKKHDGAVPVLPMKDTVYISEDGHSLTSLLIREQLFAGQAPEVFLLGKYYQANLELLPDRILQINGSAEPAVIAGLDIAMIKGDECNFKITTLTDLNRFVEIVTRRQQN